jgi:hypothetical protein
MAEEDVLLEKLADLEHQQWGHWTRYYLTTLQMKLSGKTPGFCVECGTPDPEAHAEDCNMGRWDRQASTNYADLTEKEKDTDRDWAMRVINAVGPCLPSDYTKKLEKRLRIAEEALLFYAGANRLRDGTPLFSIDAGNLAQQALKEMGANAVRLDPDAVRQSVNAPVEGAATDPPLLCPTCVSNTGRPDGCVHGTRGSQLQDCVFYRKATQSSDAYRHDYHIRHDFPTPHNIPFPRQDEMRKLLREAFKTGEPKASFSGVDYAETEMKILAATLKEDLAKAFHHIWGKEFYQHLDDVEEDSVLVPELQRHFDDIRHTARTEYRDLPEKKKTYFRDRIETLLGPVMSYASRMVVVQTRSIADAYAAREKERLSSFHLFYDFDQLEMRLHERPKTDAYPKRTPVNEARVFVREFSNLTRSLDIEIKGIRLRTCTLCGALTTSTTWKCKQCEHDDDLLDRLQLHVSEGEMEKVQELKQRDLAKTEFLDLLRRVSNIESWCRGGEYQTTEDYPKELKPR